MAKKEVKRKLEYDTPFLFLETSYQDVVMISDPMSSDKDNWVPEDELIGGQG